MGGGDYITIYQKLVGGGVQVEVVEMVEIVPK